MFDINNSRDFYAKLLADFDDFMENTGSARHAMNCAITAYHVHDWVWSDYLKDDEETRKRMGIGKKKSEFVRWIIYKGSVWFGFVQELANGSKHFNRQPAFEARRVGAFQTDAFDSEAFDVGRLIIDNGEDAGVHRIMYVSMLLEVVVRFWRDFFESYSPYSGSLPKGKTPLSDEQQTLSKVVDPIQ